MKSSKKTECGNILTSKKKVNGNRIKEEYKDS